ncbi:MAG: protein tyrosine phosphatase [Bacteroidetes bacterium]|nr:protein tyrosine phosphatase [Bacteroidota bacterium]
MNLLFVCSRNKWRSPTAEAIFKNNDEHMARSAGTENSARIRINESMIGWADIIFVMEKKHKLRLIEKYAELLEGKNIVILDIEDNYQYMDPELVAMLKEAVMPYLK